MSMVSLHNGGGVGIGKAINGGFGLVLDGSDHVDNIIRRAITWDVMGGVARRAWARNQNAIETSIAFNLDDPEQNHITLPFIPDETMIEKLVSDSLDKN
jgi:urocanate hydratase